MSFFKKKLDKAFWVDYEFSNISGMDPKFKSISKKLIIEEEVLDSKIDQKSNQEIDGSTTSQ